MKPHFYVPNTYRPVVQQGKIGNYDFAEDYELGKLASFIVKRFSGFTWNAYTFLKKMGVANEVARMVLPLSLYTSFYATVNPRNLAHFLDLRCDKQALY